MIARLFLLGLALLSLTYSEITTIDSSGMSLRGAQYRPKRNGPTLYYVGDDPSYVQEIQRPVGLSPSDLWA